MNTVFIRQGVLAQVMEPIAFNLLLGSDSYLTSGASFGFFESSSLPMMTLMMAKSHKSKSVRSRLSSFADWNHGPSLQALIQQFGASSSQSQSNNYNCDSGATFLDTNKQQTSSNSNNNNNISSNSNNNNYNNQDSRNFVLSRQCFLLNNYLLLCVRTKDGKLELLEVSRLEVYGILHPFYLYLVCKISVLNTKTRVIETSDKMKDSQLTLEFG